MYVFYILKKEFLGLYKVGVIQYYEPYLLFVIIIIIIIIMIINRFGS